MAGYQYSLVARHARANELSAACEVAERLVDTVNDLVRSGRQLRVTDVEHSGTDASRQTAEIFAEAFTVSAGAGDVALSSKEFPPYAPTQVNKRAAGGELVKTLGSDVSSVGEASANSQAAQADPVETSWTRIEKRLEGTPSTVLLLVAISQQSTGSSPITGSMVLSRWPLRRWRVSHARPTRTAQNGISGGCSRPPRRQPSSLCARRSARR